MKYIQIKGYSAKQLTWTLPKNDNVMKDKNKTNKKTLLENGFRIKETKETELNAMCSP